MLVQRFLALLVLLSLLQPGTASLSWPWSEDGKRQIKDSAWAKTLEILWNSTHEYAGFCLGARQEGVQRLIAESFQWPLPTGPASDGLCSNRTQIEARLCKPRELKLYYEFMLLTQNPEKIPDTPHCKAGKESTSCGPGFFDVSLPNRVMPVEPPQPHACCEGYFCPTMLTCMIPCPLGAYCPRAKAALPPEEYRTDGDAKWCAPYAYKERQPAGCGGADRWPVIPEGAFPNAWWWSGRGSIYCNGGSYCPNTTTKLPCMEGHFCREGSTEPDRCPPGVRCPPSTVVPDTGTTGVTVDAFLFAGLWLLWQASRWYNRVLRKLGTRERLRVTWLLGKGQPEITVVAAAPAQQHSPTLLSPPRQQVVGAGELDGADGLDAASLPHSPNAAAARGMEGSGRFSVLKALSPKRYMKVLSPKRAPPQEPPGPVWALFRGPQVLDGYEPLSDGSAGEPGERPASELVPTNTGSLQRLRTLLGRRSSTASEDATTPATLHRRLLAQQPPELLGSMRSVGSGAGAGTRPLLGVEFQNLGLRLRSCGKAVLTGVTGQLRAARTTAIMGPSGAGKTSLLNVLSGKSGAYGVQTGEVLVNGRPDRLELYKKVMGFVPQDDIMHSSLTVEENLFFSARYRLPAHYTRHQHLYYVEHAIQTLQLDEVRHELVGNEETRGISGGQKKRVNVGLELVSDPSLLFLDEPTSGLDSTASKALVVALQAVARGGVTVAAVVHQPSFESFEMFDDIIFLGKGGRTVYVGPQTGVQAYFEGLGYELPSRMNPADVYMDIISGIITRPEEQEDVEALDLFGAWEQHCGRSAQQELELGAAAEEDGQASVLVAGEEGQQQSWRARAKEALLFVAAYVVSSARDLWESGVDLCRQLDESVLGARVLGGVRQAAGSEADMDAREMRRLTKRQTPGFLPQFWWCLSRAIVKRMREPLAVFTDYAIVALTGMTLGLISDRGRSTIMHYSVSVAYSMIALGMISTVGALPTFGKDRTVFLREAASGLNRLSFFAASDFFDHFGTVTRAAVYLITWYSFASPRAVIWQMYLVSLGVVYCCAGTAYLLSQVMEPAGAQLSAAVLTLITTLIARESDPHGLLRIIKELSFARYGLEGYVIAESNRLTGVWLLARCADLQGLHYDVRNFVFCLVALFGLGVAFRLAAVLAMFLVHRDK